jgi:hypothetical protein
MDRFSGFMNNYIRRKQNRRAELGARLAAAEEVGNNIPEGNAGNGTQEGLPRSVDMEKLLRFLFWRKRK